MDLTLPSAITFLAFSLLTVATLAYRDERKKLGSRSRGAWLVDSLSLVNQGLLIPVIQTLILARLWSALMPQLQGQIKMPGALAFAANFVVVDYLYYWNHRLLHHPWFWRWHRLHHSPAQMDFYMSSRNSLLTPFLIVYVWVNSFAVFLLGDPEWFVIAAAVSSGLDLWRHSSFSPRRTGVIYRLLSPWLTLPHDHSWHHSTDQFGCNFAANLILWDALHRTLHRPQREPRAWGEAQPDWRSFIFPRGTA